ARLPPDRVRPDRGTPVDARGRRRGGPRRAHPAPRCRERGADAEPRARADHARVPAPRHRSATSTDRNRPRRMGPLVAGGPGPAHDHPQRPDSESAHDKKEGGATMTVLTSEAQQLLLAGVPTEGSELAVVVFPYDGSEVAHVWLAGEELLERALAAAAEAEPEIASIPPFRRAEILARAAELVRGREDELARQMTLETGNAIWETRFEVQRTAEILTFAADEARRIGAAGELVPIDGVPRGEGRIGLTRRFPVGTVLAITPFNAPLLLVAHKLGPAFAAGCPCIVRPASKTPLSALSLGQILLDAGAPPAAVSVVPCRTVVGGLIDEAAAEKAMSLIEEARDAGAEVLCGGTREGTVVAPTLLVGAAEEERVCAEEAFAPIVALSSYSDVDEALARANESDFGLQAGLFTNDLRIVHRAFERLEVGALIVNDVNTFRVDQMPYGGAKKSGHGREGISYAIREMTEERLLVIDPR